MANDLGPGFCGTCGDTFPTTAALNAHQTETGHEMDQPDHPLRRRADFFQPGTTYQRGRWTFQCLAVDTAPWDGELRAAGFLIRTDGTGTVHGMNREDWAHGGWIAD